MKRQIVVSVVLLTATPLYASIVTDETQAASGVPRPPRPRRQPEEPQTQRPTPGTNVGSPRLPFPGSEVPEELIANVRASMRSSGSGQRSRIVTDFKEGRLTLRARRILKVESALISPGYLLVELETTEGQWVATYAMTFDGAPLILEEVTAPKVNEKGGASRPAPIELGVAREAAQRRLAIAGSTATYVYFHNIAEPGLSICRPLAAVRTAEGTVFVNSRGEGFVDEGSSLLKRAGLDIEAKAPPSATERPLVPIGKLAL